MPAYIGPDAHRCPICDKRFESKRALFSHMAHTQAHNGMLEEIWRMRFLLAEAEREKEIYREQRNAWRDHAQGRRA